MLYGVLRDPVLLDCVEADLLQYYNIDVYSFFRGEITCRRLINLITQLPHDSRFSRRVRNDPLTSSEHLLLTVADNTRLTAYHAHYSAASQFGKKYAEIAKKGPKPTERPKYDTSVSPTEEPKKFLSGRELKKQLTERAGADRRGRQRVKTENEEGGVVGS